jgi:hypothetical protein
MDLITYDLYTKFLDGALRMTETSPKHLKDLKHKTRHFITQEGLLYKVNKRQPNNPLRVLTPQEVTAVLYSLHNDPTSGHFGFQSTYHRIAIRYYWPQMGNDIKDYIKNCIICQRRGKPKTREPLHPIKIGKPFQRIGMDIVGPLPITSKGNRYIIVATDYLTKWPEARAIEKATAANVADFFIEDIVHRHSCPQELVTDQGTHFNNHLLKTICQQLGTKHIMTSAYHPQANGLVERYNRTLCEVLAKCVSQSSKDWDSFITPALFAYRTTKHSTTHHEPFFLVYGRESVLPIELNIVTYPFEILNESQHEASVFRRIESIIGNLAEQRIQTVARVTKSQIYQKERHDKKFKIESYEIGDKVLLFHSQLDKSLSGKLEEKWLGPYYIHNTMGNGTYKLRTLEGKVLKRSAHGNRLKFYHEQPSELIKIV